MAKGWRTIFYLNGFNGDFLNGPLVAKMKEKKKISPSVGLEPTTTRLRV